MNFENINRYQLGNFMYKFVNNLLPESFSKYFTKVVEMHGHCTRSSSGGLAYRPMLYMHARNYRRFSICCNGPKIWNAVPMSIRNTPIYTQFKKLWSSYMKD